MVEKFSLPSSHTIYTENDLFVYQKYKNGTYSISNKAVDEVLILERLKLFCQEILLHVSTWSFRGCL